MADVGTGHDGLALLPAIGRLLAVDVGDVRVGLAISDASQLVATPLETMAAPAGEHDLAQALATVVSEREACAAVVGYPRTMDGREGAPARRCRDVATGLATAADVPVVLWDERFSTVEAERVLLQADLRRRDRRQVVDRVAASVILQGVLEALRMRKR